MDYKVILSVVAGLVLLNNSLYPVLPLPYLAVMAAVILGAGLLLMGMAKGNYIGKANLVIGIFLGIFAITFILGYLAISIPFITYIFAVQKYIYILGGILLLISPFT
ncbi:MAG TPA: hypothetical protein VFF28_07080 [Candidatus Nanoarchaeia archaeon]|nr:hypothetical protein [Candidatus Nanoarchaeia archaeon]